MIKSYEHAVQVQVNRGNKGVAKAVKTWAKNECRFIQCPTMYDQDKCARLLYNIYLDADKEIGLNGI